MNAPSKVFLSSLFLENYRNFSHLQIDAKDSPVIIIGENGNGKTNILESVSMLFPGRGLRHAKMEEMCKQGTHSWRVDAMMQSKLGVAELKNHFDLAAGKRLTQYNGSKITNSELSRFANIIWLTPQMEGIFLSGLTERRRFFDRIVYGFIPTHASSVSKYEHYLQERMRLIEQASTDNEWLDIIESKIAAESYAIARNRVEVLGKMQAAINKTESSFPKAIINISGFAENKLRSQESSSEAVIQEISHSFKTSRSSDLGAGRALFGTHRSEFLVTHAENGQPAKFCSTGQQKAMLISIMLAQVHALISSTGYPPILLLDEVFVHLDDRRKKYLSDFFTGSGMQVWITATETAGIKEFAETALMVEV